MTGWEVLTAGFLAGWAASRIDAWLRQRGKR